MEGAARPSGRDQLRALLISLLALMVPVAGALWFPESFADYEALLWLLALVPAFLFAYQRGWRGVATALAFGMAVLSVTYAVGLLYGHQPPRTLWLVVIVYLGLSLGIGGMAERLLRDRRNLVSGAALMDSLTGLPDRRYCEFFIEHEFAAAERGRPFSVVLLRLDDMDGFRMQFGRGAADTAVVAATEALRRIMRKMNLVGRYDRETFLCVLSNCDEEGALIFSERAQLALREQTAPRLPSTSAGVATYSPTVHSPRALLRSAVEALATAQQSGGDRIRVAGRAMVEPAPAEDEGADVRPIRRPVVGAAEDPLRGYPRVTVLASTAERGLGTGRRVLVALGEPDAPETLTAALRRDNFLVVEAPALAQALDAMRGELDLVFVHFRDPASAKALVQQVRERHPATRVVGLPPADAESDGFLDTRVDAYFRGTSGYGTFRPIMAQLLAERDWVIAAAIRNRQLADEVRATSRESRIAHERTEAILSRSQKMDAVGRLAGGIAHDFNNLLTTVRGHTELLIGEMKEGDPVREELLEIREATRRATELTRQLLAFSSRQVLQPRVLDLGAAVKDLDRMLRRVIGEDIELVGHIEPMPLRVKADPAQIDQVLLNLAVNARDAMQGGGRLTISVTPEALVEQNELGLGLEPGGYVLITVSDTGHGMDETTRARIFEPFFTTKEAGKGTGLGLSTAYGIVHQSGGHIGVESQPGRGTTFRILLPRVDEPISSVERAPSELVEEESSKKPVEPSTVLLVEDEQPVRNLVRRILEREGYSVFAAADAQTALSTLESVKDELDLLITDIVMPSMSGPQLANEVRRSLPQIPVLFVSGYSEDAIPRNGVLVEDSAFLGKPFTPGELLERVRSILSERPRESSGDPAVA